MIIQPKGELCKQNATAAVFAVRTTLKMRLFTHLIDGARELVYHICKHVSNNATRADGCGLSPIRGAPTAGKSMDSEKIIAVTEEYCAHNYHPEEVVVSEARGARVRDPEGREYYDMLSAYSALNFGHLHPEIVAAAKAQLDKVTLTSRAFHNELLGEFCKRLAELTGTEAVLPMNTGAEAVETALKTARRYGAFVKGVPDGKQHIICCEGNFHGRTTTVISMSADPTARAGYAPFTEGFTAVPYGDAEAMERAFTPYTVAVILEPIQGEAGVIVPPDGYLAEVRRMCTEKGALMIADEVQTGFARTGDMFSCLHENVRPDIYVLGKALGGGIMPVSAIASSREILGVFEPGSHGSTFGGNPLACAVALKAMEILVRDDYPAEARRKGKILSDALRSIDNPDIKEVRGRGLLVAVEFFSSAAPYIKKLVANGVLAKDTHGNTIRFAPPVNIPDDELDDAIERIKKALA